MIAHTGVPPAPHDLLAAWSPDPGAAIVIAVISLGWVRGIQSAWAGGGTGTGITRAEAGLGAGGIIALALALLSPLDSAAAALLSAHMVQHIVLVLIAAPLLALGRIHLVLLWALPPGARRAAARMWARSPLRRVVRIVAAPFAAFTLHTAAIWLWHTPLLYDAAVSNSGLHALEHASFLVTAMLFVRPIAAMRARGSRRLAHGAAILYVFASAMQSGALGALLSLSRTAWYASHLAATGAWGMSPLEDQQLAGVIMWGPAGGIYLAALLWLARDWLERAEVLSPARQSRGAAGATSEA